MKELEDKAAKDFKDTVAKYEAKVQQLSNKVQLQQELFPKPPIVNVET